MEFYRELGIEKNWDIKYLIKFEFNEIK
jgi:hypothetical protein